MYNRHQFPPYVNQYVDTHHQMYPCAHMPQYRDSQSYAYVAERQQAIRGLATWTNGGPVTECGIPWSTNEYMTVAVGEHTPFKCGETLKVKNLSVAGEREVIVTVVDRVTGYPTNRINLHRRAFEALGANPSIGVINVEFTPHPQLELEKWGKYLLEVTQVAYPNYQVTDYQLIEKTETSPTRTKEIFEFTLHSSQEQIKVRGTVIYDPRTDRVISFDIKEV